MSVTPVSNKEDQTRIQEEGTASSMLETMNESTDLYRNMLCNNEIAPGTNLISLTTIDNNFGNMASSMEPTLNNRKSKRLKNLPISQGFKPGIQTTESHIVLINAEPTDTEINNTKLCTNNPAIMSILHRTDAPSTNPSKTIPVSKTIQSIPLSVRSHTKQMKFQVNMGDGSCKNVSLFSVPDTAAVNSNVVNTMTGSGTDLGPTRVQVYDFTKSTSTDVERPFKCDLCTATFSNRGNLTRHRMIHTVTAQKEDDYRYKCKECSRLFLQKCDLNRHFLIHEKKEPYRCKLCSKAYIRESDLRVHMRFHFGDRPHKCAHCTKAFFQSGDLRRHIRTVHLRAKPLTCGHCMKKYATDVTLMRHMQTSHKDIIILSIANEKNKKKTSDKTKS